MAAAQLKEALEGEREVELTVTGRKSGQETSRPIWFVEEGDRLLLMPVGGSGANWYRNIVANPQIGLASGSAELHATAKPVEESDAVADAIERFGEKYGADKVTEYYPGQDVAVEVPLG